MTDQTFKPITFAEIQKNRRERIIVRIDEFKGTVILHAWTWVEGADGRLQAGRNGLAVALPHLPALTDALQQALAKALASGLLPQP